MEMENVPSFEKSRSDAERKPDAKDTKEEMASMRDEMAVASAKKHVETLVGKKLDYSEKNKPQVVKSGDADFDKHVGFIKAHESDHPKNKDIDPKNVDRVVLLAIRDGNREEAVVVALDKNDELLGFAD